MLRKVFLSLVLIAFSAQAVGCASTKPAVLEEVPQHLMKNGLWRRKVRRKVEPAREETKKGLAIGGLVAAAGALIGGLWYLRIFNGDDDS